MSPNKPINNSNFNPLLRKDLKSMAAVVKQRAAGKRSIAVNVSIVGFLRA